MKNFLVVVVFVFYFLSVSTASAKSYCNVIYDREKFVFSKTKTKEYKIDYVFLVFKKGKYLGGYYRKEVALPNEDGRWVAVSSDWMTVTYPFIPNTEVSKKLMGISTACSREYIKEINAMKDLRTETRDQLIKMIKQEDK